MRYIISGSETITSELDPRGHALSTAVEREAHNSISGGYF